MVVGEGIQEDKTLGVEAHSLVEMSVLAVVQLEREQHCLPLRRQMRGRP